MADMDSAQSSGSEIDAAPSLSFSGPFASPQSLTVQFKKIDNVSFMEVPAASAAGATGAVATYSGSIPSNNIPLENLTFPVVVVNNGAALSAAGKCVVGTDGTVKVYLDNAEAGLWTAAGNNGWKAFSVCWHNP